MRKLLKVLDFKDAKYVFDGNSLELFQITDKEAFAEYVKGEEEFIKKQLANKGSISKIVLNVSNKCNLNCKYCYADGGKYASKKNELMSAEVLKKIIEEILDEGVKSIEIVSFFGGEPLLNYSLIKKGIELFDDNFEVANYEIVTNGWYLNEEILAFFKEHNIKLALSIDGPVDITDFLRGKGSHEKVMQILDMVKKIEYNNFECSATYTKYHEELKYTYDDINDYFKGLGVKATISRVLSNDLEMLPIHEPTEKEMKVDIWESARKIYNNQQTGGINPYLYRTLMSLSFGARSINYCDDLFSDFSVTYDYDGAKYNCFHFWGEKEYAVGRNEICNAHILEANCKDNNKVCALCWAKYLCKICVAAVIQNTIEWPVMDNGECKDRNILQLCIECIIEYQQDEKVTELMDNFLHNFINYQ